MRLITMLLAFSFALLGGAKDNNTEDLSKYLAGAVPLKNGLVEFSKTYKVEGKSKSELFVLLHEYTQKEIVEGENHLEQARITELDEENGVIAASVEEWLYFKKKAWSTDLTRFFYQLVYQIEDGQFTITMRRIHYIYEMGASPQAEEQFRAEEWITDEEALNKSQTKLTKIGGKFRRHTIDRKDEIFKGAAHAVGAIKKKTVTIEVEE